MANENVKVVISAVDRTQKAFKSVTGGLKSITSASARMAKSVATAAAAATAAVGAMGYALSKQTAKVDKLAKTARKLGTSVSTLQELQYAAELTGVGANTLNMAMQRLTRRVSEAAGGFGEAKGALQELGINAGKLEKMPLDQKMEVIADAFGQVENQADKVRLAMKLFDSEGVSLVNTLGVGSNGLREMAQEARDLGLTIRDIDAAKFEEMNDSISKFKFAASAAATTFTIELMPLLDGLYQGFNDAGFGAENFRKGAVHAAHSITRAFSWLADMLHNLQLAFHVLKAVALSASDVVVNVLNDAMKGWVDNYNYFLGLMGKEPVSNPMADFATDIKVAAAEARIAMRALRDEPMPSEAIEEYLANYREANQVVISGNNEVQGQQRELTKWEQIRAWGQKQNAKIAESQAKNVTDAFAQQTTELAKYSKKGFALDKGVKIAQAIMNTYQGATLALATYPGPVGVALAATTVAAGMANVANIKAQKFQPSFDGGGFTGMGARAGGIDGKGGFQAILHPNETVIDHTKGQGATTNVTVNINANDTKGFDALLYKRRGQLVNIINEAVNNRGRTSIA